MKESRLKAVGFTDLQAALLCRFSSKSWAVKTEVIRAENESICRIFLEWEIAVFTPTQLSRLSDLGVLVVFGLTPCSYKPFVEFSAFNKPTAGACAPA